MSSDLDRIGYSIYAVAEALRALGIAIMIAGAIIACSILWRKL